jgi:aspartyl-tRNA(Asn)/glutamyl-tRNA(Gln) amidotransferase subunit A
MTDGIFLARPDTPCQGIPLAVKDLFDTAGLTTTYGSAIFADHVPERTAEAVRLLEADGYVVVGKANLHEFAYGVTSENQHFGTVPNPLRPGRIAGGSSGGSAAALAAGLAEAALGTDSGGSIRIPSACCGVVGFKPTYGLVPLDGCFPLAPSFDHAGPMARDVEGCARMLSALVPGFAPGRLDSLEEVVAGIAWLDGCDPLVRKRVEEAAALFPRRRAVEVPPHAEVSSADAVFRSDVADVHRELFAEFADRYSPDVRRKVRRCLEVTDEEYDAGIVRRADYRERFLEATEGVDVLVTPTLGLVAPPVGRTNDDALRNRILERTYPLNAVGWPALALPCGPAEDGLPASVQLIGRPGDDALVLAVGALLERALAGSEPASRS